MSMQVGVYRAVAALLGASAVFVGGWASIAPRSFFDSFPLPGRHWVARLPPYNEHLVRDVGGLYLALFAVSLWAAVRASTELFRLAGTAWLVFSVPHLVFHIHHLDTFSTSDAVGNVVALGGTVVLAAVLWIPQRTGAQKE